MSAYATIDDVAAETHSIHADSIELRFGPINYLLITIEWPSDNVCFIAGETRNLCP